MLTGGGYGFFGCAFGEGFESFGLEALGEGSGSGDFSWGFGEGGRGFDLGSGSGKDGRGEGVVKNAGGGGEIKVGSSGLTVRSCFSGKERLDE
jgi:hypothetical protein